MSRAARLVVPLGATAAVAVVAGCTGGQGSPGSAGTPNAPAPSSSSSDPTNSAGSIKLPAPPKELSLSGVDPCALLTSAQQAQVKVRAGIPHGNDKQYNSPNCTFQYQGTGEVPTTAYIDVNTVTTKDVTSWLDPTLYDQITEQNINGYPGLRIYPKGKGTLECTNAVGVASGQMLLVTFDYAPIGTSQRQACALSQQAAGAALTTLQSMK
jgi:hypothetical protein